MRSGASHLPPMPPCSRRREQRAAVANACSRSVRRARSARGRVRRKHTVAGKGISRRGVRARPADGASDTPATRWGELRRDLAVEPRNGSREGCPGRALTLNWLEGGETCHRSFSHARYRYRGAIPHDWDHSIRLPGQLTHRRTVPAPWLVSMPAVCVSSDEGDGV